MSYASRIKPDSDPIRRYLEDLCKKKYQIPTFQRDVVWNEDNVKKMWDSIYKFYPLGSILIWKTGMKLHGHRNIGGIEIQDENDQRNEYLYILDGQQRTTSLLTSLYGGEIAGRDAFNPALHVDLSILLDGETDDESFKKRFLYFNEIDDRNGEIKANSAKKRRYEDGLIVALRDIKDEYSRVEKRIYDLGRVYDDPILQQLRRLREIFDNYKISMIFLEGIEVSEVCQIFERINQSGMQLSIFDIVVAKTYRPEAPGVPAFYLRDLFNQFRKAAVSQFMDVDDLTILQCLAVAIRQHVDSSGVSNITDRYLNEIKAVYIESLWKDAHRALLKTFDFFENHLHLKGPQLIPFRYFYLTIFSYFFRNQDVDYNLLKRYFWYYSFHNEDLLTNTTHLWHHVENLKNAQTAPSSLFGKLVIDRNKLRTASYSSKGRISRAILSLYASKIPKDWSTPDRNVLADVYFILTDKPNLHHVFPLNFIANNPSSNMLDSNSLMNIVYLTQITNLKISDKNPIQYLNDYTSPQFESVISDHLLPLELMNWAQAKEMPTNSLDLFIEKRIDLVIDAVKEYVKPIIVDIMDSRVTTSA